MTPRPYDLGLRARAMDERRARIIAAARQELLASPRFTLEAVAERAAVSRVTVYAPVSYTHLDVYKRQVVSSRGSAAIQSAAVSVPVRSGGPSTAVWCG